jgi:site-specific DNA recombinase
MADLLRAARSPEPPFAFVICEDIERSARDNYNSLKLERQLRDEGIAIFATDEPFSIKGSTRPPSSSAASSRASRNGTGSS